MPSRRVVITGAGVVSAAGVGRAAFREAVRLGESHIRRIDLFEAVGYPVTIGGQVRDFDPGASIDRKTVARTPRNTQFALIAAAEALAEADLDLTREDPTRLGGVMAATSGGAEHAERGLATLIARGPSYVSAFLAITFNHNGAMSQLSIAHNLQGHTQTVVSEAAAGAEALRIATEFLQDDDEELDAALAGGCSAPLWSGHILPFAGSGLLATDEREPAAACRPFDARQSGTVLAEAGAVLVLEGDEHARARGVKPLAEVAGFGSTFDAVDPVGFDPSGTWQAVAMREAMSMAGLGPNDLDAVIAEGQGVYSADQAEANAIARALDGAVVPVTCIKGAVGHALAAAGTLDAVCALDMMAGGYIPPIVNLEQPSVTAELDFVRREPRRADVRTVLVGARGLAGVNIALVLRRVDA